MLRYASRGVSRFFLDGCVILSHSTESQTKASLPKIQRGLKGTAHAIEEASVVRGLNAYWGGMVPTRGGVQAGWGRSGTRERAGWEKEK